MARSNGSSVALTPELPPCEEPREKRFSSPRHPKGMSKCSLISHRLKYGVGVYPIPALQLLTSDHEELRHFDLRLPIEPGGVDKNSVGRFGPLSRLSELTALLQGGFLLLLWKPRWCGCSLRPSLGVE